MSRNKSSLLSKELKIFGQGKILPYLRGDLSQAKKQRDNIGPWIDIFFVKEVLNSIKRYLNRFIVRMWNKEIDKKHFTL